MKGGNELTPAIDVYAFAIVCVEILDGGTLPWQHHDDPAVVRFVVGQLKLFYSLSLFHDVTF